MAAGHSTGLWDLIRAYDYLANKPKTFEEETNQMLGRNAEIFNQKVMQNKAFLDSIDPNATPAQQIQSLSQNPNITSGTPYVNYLLNDADVRLKNSLASPAEKAQTNLAKLIAERNALFQSNPGDPYLSIYDQAINKAATPQSAVSINLGSLTPARNAQGQDVFIRPNPKGGVVEEPGYTPARDLTEGQQKSFGYFNSMNEASRQINSLVQDSGLDLADPKLHLGMNAAQSGLGNVIASTIAPELQATAQTVDAAQKRWSAALLYSQTGATAQPGEVKNAQTNYWPVAGDSQLAIQAKARARAVMENTINTASGQGQFLNPGAKQQLKERLQQLDSEFQNQLKTISKTQKGLAGQELTTEMEQQGYRFIGADGKQYFKAADGLTYPIQE